MESLQIERTEYTPNVIFDPEDLQFTLRGASRPKNAKKFYKPLIQWLEEFASQLPVTSAPLSVEVKLLYYNSASLPFLTHIFQLISKMHATGMRVIIDWHVAEEHDFLKEAGLELSESSGLPFNFIEE